MIPKRMFFYWSGNNLSWMRYMTLYSFRKFNPDWEIVLYLSDNNNTVKTWNSPEEQDFINYKGINYLDKITELNIKIEKVIFLDPNNSKYVGLSPVHESDLFRYYQLYTNGGFYCDMDVLFFRPIDEFYNYVTQNNFDTIVYQCSNYMAIGFLGASVGNSFYKGLFEYGLAHFNTSDYQSLGVDLIYGMYGGNRGNSYVLDMVKQRNPNLKIYNIPTSLIYHYDWTKIDYNYNTPIGINGFNQFSVGYHWFGGSGISQRFNNILTEDNYREHGTTFSELVKEIGCDSLTPKVKKENKFIIVVPVYNAAPFIEKCIFSILNQEYQNFDMIVVDDCSSDNTSKILKKLYKEYDFELIVNEERLRSPLENFIRGIETMSTDKEDIIVTVDGDDYLANDKVLTYLNEVYQDENIWMSYGQFVPSSNSYGKYCKPIPDIRTYRRSGEWFTSALRTVKRKLFDKIDRNDLKDETGGYYKAAGDLAYMFPIVEMAGPKHIKFIDEVLYIYNDMYPGNEMKTDRDRQLMRATEIRQKPLYDELDKI